MISSGEGIPGRENSIITGTQKEDTARCRLGLPAVYTSMNVEPEAEGNRRYGQRVSMERVQEPIV